MVGGAAGDASPLAVLPRVSGDPSTGAWVIFGVMCIGSLAGSDSSGIVCGERARSGATLDVVAVSAEATEDRDGPFVLCVAADASDIRGFRDAASESDWDGDLASPPLDLFSAGYLILPDVPRVSTDRPHRN